MEKLQITIDGNKKTIEADTKICKGIYAVTESHLVKKNIQKLSIKFDETLADNILQNRICKIEKWAFLTSKASDQYLQYIFMPSASQEDFNDFLQEVDDPTMKQMLTDTYNMITLNMQNLDLLDKLRRNRN